MKRLAGACVVALAACGTAPNRRVGVNSSVTVSACPDAQNATRRAMATLVLTIRTDPAAPDSAQASVRINGERSRSDITVSAAGGSKLELERGVYGVRVALRGYEPVMATATLTGGCSAEMIANLRRR